MSAWAGAMGGAEIGAVGGPLGAAAGAVIGLAIGVGVTILAAKAIDNARSKSQSQLQDSAPAQACSDCGDGPDCFEPPDRSDPKSVEEFRRQLKGQQAGINEMSPQEVIDNSDKYAAGGRDAYPGEPAMRRNFREQAWDDAYRDALADTGDEAAASAAADNALRGTAALHNPDLVAGGKPQPTDLGGASENSSIGAQWAKKGPKSRLTRAQQLRKAAEKAKQARQKKMNVNLEEC